MIEFKKFEMYMNKYKELHEIQVKIQEASKTLEGFSYGCFEHEDFILDLLSDLMEDECDYIFYFVLDLEFGTKYKSGMIKDDLGYIRLSTIEDLYRVIIGKPIYEI